MAELVDASDSKSDFGNGVGVRFPLPAPVLTPTLYSDRFLGRVVGGGGVLVIVHEREELPEFAGQFPAVGRLVAAGALDRDDDDAVDEAA